MSRAAGTNNTGRSIPGPQNRIARKRGGPPKGEAWVWLTRAMLSSPAWAVLKVGERRILDRLMIEHMNHSGGENGNLICTYNQLGNFGVRRKSISTSLDILEALGWIAIRRGGCSYAGDRTPSRYYLSWLPSKDGNAAPNRWKRLKTKAEALKTIRAARTRANRHVDEFDEAQLAA